MDALRTPGWNGTMNLDMLPLVRVLGPVAEHDPPRVRRHQGPAAQDRVCGRRYPAEDRRGAWRVRWADMEEKHVATGRNIQLTKQVGEYLVAAELCRRRLMATTFTGNVPDYDIVAVSDGGVALLVQVKAIRGGLWQIGDARSFIEITLDGKKQVPGKLTLPQYRELFYVFVLLDRYGQDRFFIVEWRDLQRLVADHYRANLEKHGSIRPRRHDSFHAGLSISMLAEFEDRWEILEEAASRDSG